MFLGNFLLLHLNTKKTQFLQSLSQMPCHLKVLLFKRYSSYLSGTIHVLEKNCILTEVPHGLRFKLYSNGDLKTLRVRNIWWNYAFEVFGWHFKTSLFHFKIGWDPICRCLTPLRHICNWHNIQQTGSVHLYTATHQVKKCIGSI